MENKFEELVIRLKKNNTYSSRSRSRGRFLGWRRWNRQILGFRGRRRRGSDWQVVGRRGLVGRHGWRWATQHGDRCRGRLIAIDLQHTISYRSQTTRIVRCKIEFFFFKQSFNSSSILTKIGKLVSLFHLFIVPKKIYVPQHFSA